MTKEQLQQLAEMTAERTAAIVLKKIESKMAHQQVPENDLVDTAEAARLLGISPAYMRIIKDRFPHVKLGDSPKGRLMFKKSELLANY